MVAIKSKPLSRRTLLRGGAGVAIALPLLDIMLNEHGTALAQGTPLPARFISWFFGAGFDIDKTESRTANFTPINATHPNNPHLAPFAGIENYVTVCSGYACPPGGIGDNHHKGRTTRYSGFVNTGGGTATGWGGPTIDQVIADAIGATSSAPIASLQVGVSKFGATDGLDSGTTSQFLSMRNGGIGLAAEVNPKEVWKALFSGTQVPEHKRSILDYVADDLNRLKAGLGQADLARIEAHASIIRQIEQSLIVNCAQPTEPAEDNSQGYSDERIIEVNRAMADLVALAFECDLTRVVSVEFSKIAGDPEYWQAEPQGWRPGARQHEESHNGADLSSYSVGCGFALTQLSEWLFRLRGTDRNGMQVGVSNLLDSTILYASSDVGQGFSHTQQRAPMILGGRGSKNGLPYLRTGQSHMAAGAENNSQNMPFQPADPRTNQPGKGNSSDILLTCLRCFQPNATRNTNPTSVGDATVGATGFGIDALIDPGQV